MRLINESSRPTDEVRQLVKIGASGIRTVGTTVVVRDGRRRTHGRAWWGGVYWRNRWHDNGLIKLWLGPDWTFPKRGWRRHKNSPHNHDWQDWREALVALAAHEAKHIERGPRLGNGKAGEMACEAHERWVLDRYRAASLESQVRDERDDHADSDDDE